MHSADQSNASSSSLLFHLYCKRAKFPCRTETSVYNRYDALLIHNQLISQSISLYLIIKGLIK